MLRCQALPVAWLPMLGYSTGLIAVDWNTITDGHGNHLPDFSFAGCPPGYAECREWRITQGRARGPNAVVRHVARGARQSLYPHQRSARGFLADHTAAPVELVNRGTAGSGQGWSINAGVAWSARGAAKAQGPPLGVNWAVGLTGPVMGSNGTFVSSGAAVSPASLFDAQLARRRDQVK